MRNLYLAFILAVAFHAEAQELNATVTIDAEQTGNLITRFQNSERSTHRILNNTQWTSQEVLNQERIDCNLR